MWPESSAPCTMAGKKTALPDEELAHNVGDAGDNDPFAELFAQVFYACGRFFSDWHPAEHATQETFLRAFKNIRGFQQGDFSHWLLRIAKNACIDEWRRRRPETAIDGLELTGRAAPNSFASLFETRQMMERLWLEIRLLPCEQRQCLELKIEGFSNEEAAARTGFTVNAVKSHLQNGRRMLPRKMEGALPQLVQNAVCGRGNRTLCGSSDPGQAETWRRMPYLWSCKLMTNILEGDFS